MKKIGKGFILLLAVLLIATGFPVKQASADPISTSSYYNMRDMRTWAVVGNGYTTRGGFVGALQSNLWASGYSSTVGTVDQIFGSATRSGVINFQRKYGLATDGIVGRGTWGKMDQMTSKINGGMRVFRGSSSSYQVDYIEGNSFGGANTYVLRNSNTGAYIKTGQMWKTPSYPIPQQLLKEPSAATPPTKEELAEIDIPVNLNYSSKAQIATQADPEILVYDDVKGEKSVISWVHTDANPILVSESTFDTGIGEMVKEAASWHAHYDVEITNFKGNPMVVSNKGDGFFKIHIITPEKLFTVGGAEKDILLSVAEEINFK